MDHHKKNQPIKTLICLGITIFLTIGLGVSADAAGQRPIHELSYDEIMKRYVFINDFGTKQETRPHSKELFWKYRYTIPEATFAIEPFVTDPVRELPVTVGEGRAAQHINEGRKLYLEGLYEEARIVWLSGRARFGKKYPYHRRLDYYIALSFLAKAGEERKEKGHSFDKKIFQEHLINAATFLSWAFIIKDELPDPVVEEATPKQLFNLAAIYFMNDRFAGSYGAADKGLNFLRKSGRKEYRAKLRSILAEAHIRNRSYVDAINEIDQALRQDPSKDDASHLFGRAADIYFDLNNYEIAEGIYAISNRIGIETNQTRPNHFVLRGESLFWLGKYSEAQKMFYYGLQQSAHPGALEPLSLDYAANAQLRIADSYLAMNKIEKAKLEYFRVLNEFRATPQGKIAAIRSACLELPLYKGNNVDHARTTLSTLKNSPIATEALELAWACEVSSYTERERTEEMVSRVQEFYKRHPNSRFLEPFIKPIEEVKASKLDEYFAKNQPYAAISFFEKTRTLLFKKIAPKLQKNLFKAYVDSFQTEKAKEFWPEYAKDITTETEKIRAAVFAAEVSATAKEKKWLKLNKKYEISLQNIAWKTEPADLLIQFVNRILVATSGQHIIWVFNLAEHWARLNNRYTCELVYPTLIKIYNNHKQLKVSLSDLKKRVSTMVSKNLPGLLLTDEGCGMSMLDLEISIFKDEPLYLVGRFLERSSWPMTKALASIFWNVSERALADGSAENARSLWRIIADKAPKDAPEKKFAKVRMENNRLEYDDLWSR